MSYPLPPAWMPPPGTLAVLPAGHWWDAIVLPQQLGLDALQHLDSTSEQHVGPVIWDAQPPRPRLYFLVPVGVSEGWGAPGEAHGRTTFIGVPGPTTLEPPGPHWLIPPSPDTPDALVDPIALAAVLRQLTPERTA